ncbi:MAG: YqgE/AlgH family protein [Rickettsiales bacterium]
MPKIKETHSSIYSEIGAGDIIISSPYTEMGVIFNKTVIYIISHSQDGTTGVIINKLLKKVDSETILKALDIDASSINLKDFNLNEKNISIYFGGPIEQNKGIMLQSESNNIILSTKINDYISVSNSLNIVNDLTLHAESKYNMIILGYSSWGANHLLSEIKDNNWVVLSKLSDRQVLYNLIFANEHYLKWNMALKLAGIKPGFYNNCLGRA